MARIAVFTWKIAVGKETIAYALTTSPIHRGIIESDKERPTCILGALIPTFVCTGDRFIQGPVECIVVAVYTSSAALS